MPPCLQNSPAIKKLILLTGFIFFITSGIYAQELSELGEISNAEIDMKSCSFDTDADAVILLHEAVSDYDDERHLITIHHVRIKILKKNGLDAANVSIPFYRKNNFEQIDKVEGITINFGENRSIEKVKLERKSIYTTQTNERYGEVIFAFPAVQAGSIIDYKYRSSMKHYGGLDEWYFQDELPVITSKYLLSIVPNTEFAYRVNVRPDRNVVIKPDPDNGKIYFEMTNIPGLRNEPYMDARKDYIQKVIFQLSGYKGSGNDKKEYMTSWDAVNREMYNATEFGIQLRKNISASELMNQVKLLAAPEEKMKTVYDYVRNYMNWNGLYSKFSTDGIKNAWGKRSGSSGDINLLLVNLLNEAGLEAFPMLVSERFYGKVNTSYPFIDQFNSVFACVNIQSKKYYLDATDKFCPSHIIPVGILNTTGFIVKKRDGELVQISNDALQYKENVISFIDVLEDGSVNAKITVNSEGYARMDKLENYKKDKDKFRDNYFHAEGLALNIKKFEVKNEDNDSLQLAQEFEFTSILNSSGDYKYLPMNFLPGFKSNPFLSDNRFSNINFGYPKKITLYANISLADKYLADELPKAVTMVTPDRDISFQRQVTYNKADNTIVFNLNIEFKKSIYTPDEYPVLKEVYKKIFEYLKEPLLLKKK